MVNNCFHSLSESEKSVNLPSDKMHWTPAALQVDNPQIHCNRPCRRRHLGHFLIGLLPHFLPSLWAWNTTKPQIFPAYCSWPSGLWCRPEQQLVCSAVTPWCGSAGTASAAPPPPPAWRSDSVRWLITSPRGSAVMHSSSSPPRPPRLQNEDASFGMLSPEEQECPPPPAAVKHRKTNVLHSLNIQRPNVDFWRPVHVQIQEKPRVISAVLSQRLVTFTLSYSSQEGLVRTRKCETVLTPLLMSSLTVNTEHNKWNYTRAEEGCENDNWRFMDLIVLRWLTARNEADVQNIVHSKATA